MKVSRLNLYNFRNYENEYIDFGDEVNIIHGDNGMGKTNILEAVYYFSYGRSFRSGGREVIKDGEKEGRIALDFKNEERDFKGEIKFLSGKIMSILPCVMNRKACQWRSVCIHLARSLRCILI